MHSPCSARVVGNYSLTIKRLIFQNWKLLKFKLDVFFSTELAEAPALESLLEFLEPLLKNSEPFMYLIALRPSWTVERIQSIFNAFDSLRRLMELLKLETLHWLLNAILEF